MHFNEKRVIKFYQLLCSFEKLQDLFIKHSAIAEKSNQKEKVDSRIQSQKRHARTEDSYWIKLNQLQIEQYKHDRQKQTADY